MPWGPDVETNLAISSANHLKVRFIQQSPKKYLIYLYNIIFLLLNNRFFIGFNLIGDDLNTKFS
ncbi:hypothetical protein E3U36_10575 [Arsenophonus endosymbiont of Aphis craccivora]|uniref:hypothetical protein n=1 Tax=Arsenophonus endosymbiont of Aphis craccivora TaxID=1231049 RepID=UPI0015DCA271|nr:hypothetical protein [Arsenophonus endosymbiont of Aphis craccivora]QLK88379.1 hypothetical protein E3U36_10575 [Arsenophonus endosymbiont of Aphis craccivora]